MLSAIKTAIFGGNQNQQCAGTCSACDPALLARCQPAEPGSVGPHSHHVLVRLPQIADAAKEVEQNGAWWPESVDKEPAIAAVSAAVKAQQERLGGKVKVTAFDDVAVPQQQQPGSPPLYEALVFPAGLRLSGVPLEGLGEAVVGALTGGAAGAQAAWLQQRVEGLTLLVCTHGKRDSRCGVLGTQLAHRLVALLEAKGLSQEVRVLKTSHIGGHVVSGSLLPQYAGNVLVYGGASPCNGDWFGGVNADNAEEFLQALLETKVEGSADPNLRRLWRGRVGLSKDEQKALFEANVNKLRDIEDLKAAA
ncbi:hypothetical protein N2152v2_001350 [Parachlorella kessleri]